MSEYREAAGVPRKKITRLDAIIMGIRVLTGYHIIDILQVHTLQL